MASEKQSHDATIEAPDRYSVFTTVEKWCIVAMVSYAAWFSTLSSFIYYPALDSISRALSVSVNKVNLTVTSYLAVATIAPTLVGDTADVLGRRPVYLIVLTLYFVADVAIALSQDYSALLGLRVLQAAAISGMHFRHALVFFLAPDGLQGPSPSPMGSSPMSLPRQRGAHSSVSCHLRRFEAPSDGNATR